MNGKIFIALTFLLLSGVIVSAGVMDSDWPMIYHDLAHTGFSNATSNFSMDNMDLLSTFEAQGKISAPIAIDINNDDMAEILFGSSDNNLYVLNSNCEELWTYKAGGAVSTPAVFDLWNNTKLEILFGSLDNKLYALDANGTEIWVYETNGSITTSPVAVNLDNSPNLEILFVSNDENLYVLNPHGKKLWDYPLFTRATTPAIGDINSDGKLDILLGSINNRLYVIDLPDLRIWSFQTSGDVPSPVVANIDGSGDPEILMGSGDGHLYSLYYREYERGSVRRCNEFTGNCTVEHIKYSTIAKDWDYETFDGIVSTPAVADLDRDGRKEIIVGSRDKALYIISNTGKIRKRYSINGRVLSSPAIADLDGDKKPEGFRKWSYETDDVIKEPPAVADLDRDGNLEVLLASGNKLYVFGYKSLHIVESTTTTSTTLQQLLQLHQSVL